MRLRGKIRLRARWAQVRILLLSIVPAWREREKLRHELAFWTDIWDARLRSGAFWNDDVKELLESVGEWPGKPPAVKSYEEIRCLEARAHGLRILKEAGIDDPGFFRGKKVVDIGPGAVCFLELSGAQVGIAIEPLADRFEQAGLLLPSVNTIYLSVPAERLPLLDNTADIVVSRNNLDHVGDPEAVVDEVRRILKRGGTFILIVHLESSSSVTEPHAFSLATLRPLLRHFHVRRETIQAGGRTEAAETYAGVLEKL